MNFSITLVVLYSLFLGMDNFTCNAWVLCYNILVLVWKITVDLIEAEWRIPNISQYVVIFFDSLFIFSLRNVLSLEYILFTKYFSWPGAPTSMSVLIFNVNGNVSSIKQLIHIYILICRTICFLLYSWLVRFYDVFNH